MPTCRSCGTESSTESLDRHVHEGLLVVRCPECGRTMGRWRDRGLHGDCAGAEESDATAE